MKNIPIKITLSIDIAKKLRAIARLQKRTVSAVVALWVEREPEKAERA